ncbi:hypothetical protein Tco_0358895 [Tanacetum coccineum]
MSQEQRQQAARDEKLVPSADRVKISTTNMRIEPTLPQKEETFQGVLDIIKASPCFKAFTITADKFSVAVKLFRKILDICPRVPNEDFVAPPSEEDLFTFLIELGYNGPLDHLARMSQPHIRGSSEGAGVTLEVPDESTVVLTTSSEGTGTKPWVLDETDDDEEIGDEFVHGDEYVHDDVDTEMKDAKVDDTGKDDEEITDADKADVEKTEEVKGDNKKAELPSTSSSLSISFGFEVPHIQSPSILTIPVSVIPDPTVLSPILEIPIVTPSTTLLPPPSVTNLTPILQQTTTKIPSPPITTVAPAATTVPYPLLSQVPVAVDEYLGSSLGDALCNPTPTLEPILSTSPTSLTPLREVTSFWKKSKLVLLANQFHRELMMPTSIQKKTFSPLKDCLNSDPTSTLPLEEQKFKELKTVEPSSDELPELELKDLPPHLEYAFLEGTDKLPVIIAKDLKDEDKTTFLKVLRSHKRAIAWKISDIKGIDPKFYTHKILMEENVKPTVQHQRRVNPKIHEVIKKEVIKLLEAGLIYPISDSPWVSPVHCLPKKGGITVIENDENELIPTRLITGWRVCIDYQKLNDATRKDHFPLPFMDQMLERLVGNEYYCFLDGFSGYFQIPIDPQDQKKTTFTCPYGTFILMVLTI